MSRLERRIVESGEGCKPRSGGAGGAVEGKSVVETSDSVFEDPEPRFDERPISPRFTLVLTV